MNELIGRFICFIKRSHKRGKFVRAEDQGKTKIFGCPRCKRETRYTVKAASVHSD